LAPLLQDMEDLRNLNVALLGELDGAVRETVLVETLTMYSASSVGRRGITQIIVGTGMSLGIVEVRSGSGVMVGMKISLSFPVTMC